METSADRFNAAVGRQLRAEIAADGSSIAAMAREIGIARSALDNYVTGKRAIPVPIVYEICAVLGIDPRVVIARAEERFAAEQAATNVTHADFSVGRSREDLETVRLDSSKIAASKDNTPVDPSRGEK